MEVQIGDKVCVIALLFRRQDEVWGMQRKVLEASHIIAKLESDVFYRKTLRDNIKWNSKKKAKWYLKPSERLRLKEWQK
jgi:hypothetical protein